MPAERTLEWVRKAEEDWAVIGLIRAADPGTAPDVLVFLCQQCVEKYLKALLCEEGLAVPRTHDLASLLLELLVIPLPQHPSELPDRMTGNDLIVQENYEFGLEKQMVDSMDRVDRRDKRGEIISFTSTNKYRFGYGLIFGK